MTPEQQLEAITEKLENAGYRQLWTSHDGTDHFRRYSNPGGVHVIVFYRYEDQGITQCEVYREVSTSNEWQSYFDAI